MAEGHDLQSGCKAGSCQNKRNIKAGLIPGPSVCIDPDDTSMMDEQWLLAGALLDDDGTKRSTGQEESWTGAFMGLSCVEKL